MGRRYKELREKNMGFREKKVKKQGEGKKQPPRPHKILKTKKKNG